METFHLSKCSESLGSLVCASCRIIWRVERSTFHILNVQFKHVFSANTERMASVGFCEDSISIVIVFAKLAFDIVIVWSRCFSLFNTFLWALVIWKATMMAWAKSSTSCRLRRNKPGILCLVAASIHVSFCFYAKAV